LSARAWSGASSARTRAWVSAVVEFMRNFLLRLIEFHELICFCN
jgi:hypothetical protein